MDEITLDARELRQLAVDLGTAPLRAMEDVRATIQRAAYNIKADLQAEATGEPRFARVAAAISYDTRYTPDGVEAEIGPESGYERGNRRAQGALAYIAYEGSAVSAPVFPDPIGALEREADTLTYYLSAAVGDRTLP